MREIRMWKNVLVHSFIGRFIWQPKWWVWFTRSFVISSLVPPPSGIAILIGVHFVEG